jgi:hypothetical protein
MLDVAYEAIEDLEPGRLARIDEDRGTIRVRLDKHAPLADVVRQLNIEIDRLMSSSHWFQLWDEEIVSRDTPNCSLRIHYLLDCKVPNGVGVAEARGLLRVYIDPAIDTTHFAAVMNPATKEHLDGGCWFQMFAGEIIDNSPEPMSQV